MPDLHVARRSVGPSNRTVDTPHAAACLLSVGEKWKRSGGQWKTGASRAEEEWKHLNDSKC